MEQSSIALSQLTCDRSQDEITLAASSESVEPSFGLEPVPAATTEPDAITQPDCITNTVGCSNWRIFTSTFVTIFLAEIGDKTQMSTLLISAQFHKPWTVFLGASTALIATTLVGVLLGRWLSTRLSPRTLDVASGILLALISLSLFWDVLQS